MQLLPRMDQVMAPAVASAADDEEDEAAYLQRRSQCGQRIALLLTLIVGIAAGSLGTYLVLGHITAVSGACAPFVTLTGTSTASDRMPWTLVDWLLEPIDALEAKYGMLSEARMTVEHAPARCVRAQRECAAAQDRVWCVGAAEDCADPVGWLALLGGGPAGFSGGQCHLEVAGSESPTEVHLARWPAASAADRAHLPG